MLRSIAKWYVSRSIDCDQPMPRWVERRLAHDPTLSRFYDQSLQLTVRLRTVGYAVDTPVRVALTRSKRAGRYATLTVGLAAIFFLALIPFFNQPVMIPTEVSIELANAESSTGIISTPVDPKPLDPKRLRELLDSGRTLVQGLKQRAGKLADPATEVEYEQLSVISELDVDQLIKPVTTLGSNYGELLSQFDRHVEAENRRIIADGMSAWHFFVHKLPQSAASLAGL